MLNRLVCTVKLLLFIVLPVMTMSVYQAYADDDDERQNKAVELHALKTRIAALTKELEAVRTLHDRVRQALRESEHRINLHVKNLRKIQQQLNQHQQKLRKLKGERLATSKELVKHRELLAKQVRTAYSLGKQEYIKLLLNQQQPAAIGRMLTYYDYFNRERVNEIQATQKTLKKLSNLKVRILQQQANLNAAQQAQLHEKQALEASSKERALVMAKLSAEIKSKDQALQQLIQNQRNLERVVNVITETLPETVIESGKQLPFGQLRGKLTWPALGKVKQLFGKKRESGRMRWNGILIQAPLGNNVRAVAPGRIAYANWLRGYGLLMIIDHGDGYMSLYGHNQSLMKETGDWVSAGDLIGTVGHSGGQQQSNLYFEIRHKGKPVNPARWCKRLPS